MKRPIIAVAFLVVSVTGAVALTATSETAAKILNFGTNSDAGDKQSQSNSIVLPDSPKNVVTTIAQSSEEQSAPVQINNVDRQTPDYVFFDMLFNLVRSLDEAAAKLESEGTSGRIWSEYLEQQAGLSRQQVNKLRQAADEFNRAVEPTHRQAMQIINERMAAATSGQRPTPPPPPQLLALQQQRQTIAVAHGNRLQAQLGAEVVERLRRALTQNSSGDAQPLSPAERQLLHEQSNRKESRNNE